MKKIYVDWGSTNFRAYLIDSCGNVKDKIINDRGVLSIVSENFEKELKTILYPWSDLLSDCEIWLSGMIGSRRGWREVEYCQAPANVSDLFNKSLNINTEWAKSIKIVPGVTWNNGEVYTDVMRGEEVQLIGLGIITKAKDIFAMLPGTHNKHVKIFNGSIDSFCTHPTGELYSTVTKHMLIGYGLDSNNRKESLTSFYRGIDEGVKSSQLGKSLFSSWTKRLSGWLSDEDALDYISGILIGNELRDFPAKYCAIVSDASIGYRYLKACSYLGINSDLFSGDECFISGMAEISEWGKK